MMRKDNFVCLIAQDGTPLDPGAENLARQRKLPTRSDLTLGRAKVTNLGSHKLILLPCKQSQAHDTNRTDLLECLRSLLDVTNELSIQTISMSKFSPDRISWSSIRDILLELFSASSTQIFACSNEVVIPPPHRWTDIITENHVSAFAGHKGISKTYKRIRHHYYWPTLKVDVQNFINSCQIYQLQKLTRTKTRQPMVLTDTPGRAFDKVSLDIVGPLLTTPAGRSYILTIQDLLTKYSLAIPISQPTARDTADAFVKAFICRFGAPKAILTDQGSNFMSQHFKSVAKRFRISQIRTTAFHPQSNGSIERSHHVLTEYLKHYIAHNNWDEWLDLAMFFYNTSVHESTRFTPHEHCLRECSQSTLL